MDEYMVTRATTIEFEHLGIGTALLRNRLVVPLNQREYSWEDSHVLDLFHDLANAIDSQKPSYFLGTIVLTRSRDGALEVTDGQQRLATTTILLAAIRDYFQDRNDPLLVESLDQFLFTIVRETRETNPRLRLNVDDNEFFRSRVLAKKGAPERRGVRPQKPSHVNIERAAKLAEEHIQNIIRSHSDPNRIDRLNAWVKFIEESALVILLKVLDDLNAYVMFETLNDRGLRTSQSDLVKNYLFARADDRIMEAQQKWASMNGALETLEQDDVTITYLRHLLISLWGHTREREVFGKVKEKVSARQQAIEFLDDLADNANDYVAIQTPTHAKWNEYHPNIRQHVRTIVFLQLTPLRPLMLAVSKRFSKKQTELAFRQFVFWSVRFLVSGGARSGAMDEAVAKAAQEVSAGRIDTANKLANQLKDILPTDLVFESKFATETVAKNALARYYLRALELKREGNLQPEWIPNESVDITLEHVLPENSGQGWPNLDPTIVRAYYKRIGNMVLLLASPNAAIGNKPFSEKKGTLLESTYQLTREVGTSDVWGPKEIEERQKRLAQLAVETWPLRAQ
jgi:hypothetical protein